METERSQTISIVTPSLVLGFTLGCVLMMAAFGGLWLGSSFFPMHRIRPSQPLFEAIHATATHGGSNMAVATGTISEDTEGVFFLDYLTGDLQCWVYYPRTGLFGAKYAANITAQLPGGKNPEYLLVTGGSLPSHASNNTRPANCLAYVVDVHSGTFAAYGVPWNTSAEKSGQLQQGTLIPVGGGQIRNPIPASR